ncbi:hypothetical protein ACVXHA_22515 [Escherichia coli]
MSVLQPLRRVTAQYNQDRRYWLETPTIPAPPIELVEIQRLRYQEMPISASRVRQLLAKNDLTAIAPLVPAVTLHCLQNPLSTPARTRQLVKRPPHEKQVKNENKPARRCRHP